MPADTPLTPRDLWLQRRLEAAVQHFADGSADRMGRMLGYANGGYIRESLNGKKKVRAALIERIHGLPGGENWFSNSLGTEEPPADAHVLYLPKGGQILGKHPTPMKRLPTVGDVAQLLAKALDGLSGARLTSVANSISALILQGPSLDQAEVIDTLTQGRTVSVQVDYAKHAWRAAAFSLASAASNPQDRALLERFVEAVDQYVAENPPE